MHLRSISIKGFKSFPDRTRLEFTPGVAVIVGPNGSGKSNITDAVMWALGEQSPLAVRGQSMQDVIFAGAPGMPSRSVAEVEVVIDNAEGRLGSPFSEVSVLRRLDRSGEGEYRLNGARCRLVDVLEALSDTGLGQEMHSVVSQGRIESIVHSRPRDRRMLIEEAAGLGKHRKRRRRAELKLRRTEANLARALDVEREARTRLRPLKRQAEAAELHARLERQTLEHRLALAADDAREADDALLVAVEAAATAGGEREAAEGRLAAVSARRREAEERFATHNAEREAASAQVWAARSAGERLIMRLERARELGRAATDGAARGAAELARLDGAPAPAEAPVGGGPANRCAALEAELGLLDRDRDARLAEELTELERAREEAAGRLPELERAVEALREQAHEAAAEAERTRTRHREAERTVQGARAAAADTGADLAGVLRFLRGVARPPGDGRPLAELLRPAPGYEGALGAALGPLLGAGVVDSVAEGEAMLDAAGADGGVALLASAPPPVAGVDAPVPGAERLLAHVAPGDGAGALAERLLGSVWVVDSLAAVSAEWRGVAVTRAGRVLHAGRGEVRQAPAAGSGEVLEGMRRRDVLASASEAAARAEVAARAAATTALEAVGAADTARDKIDREVRERAREHEDGLEALRRVERSVASRRGAPEEGPAAVRRAEVVAELRAEKRLAEQVERERAERDRRIERLRRRVSRDEWLGARAERAAAAFSATADALSARRALLEERLDLGSAVAEETAARLRSCAAEESEIQARLRRAGEEVTRTEVALGRARDRAAEGAAALAELSGRLGWADPPPAAGEPLPSERRSELTAAIERLTRRRESLGPVNPLAGDEYEEAVAHVEELEGQRSDLEAALAELGGLIADLDRRIRDTFDETFRAAAANFEEVVGHLFPGGRGRLRLVHPGTPRAVLGGAASPEAEGDDAGETGENAEAEGGPSPLDPGVEVEVTPAGKSMKALSLLSGGEKSLVALAFLFAVFLARPCPFYVLDEVEAALDDLNIERFLELVRRFSDRAQFIVVTHQKRTMEAADCLYGVSMSGDGVSKVLSRRLSGARAAA